MKFIIVCLSCLVALSVDCLSQQLTIKGNVVDALTGSPLAKANIYTGHKKGGSSDATGSYLYEVVQGELMTLTCSYSGYESASVSFVPASDTTINFVLEPKVYDLNTFIVTGVQRERVLQDSPLPIQVVTQDEIEKMGYSEVTDVLSNSIPGISLQEDNMGTAITIDGLSSKYVLILIDGKRIAGETDGNIDFSRLNTINIDRIEVTKGSGSLLYGSNAISGVVNIITKSAKEDGVDVSLLSRYATYNTYNVGAVANVKKGAWKSTTDMQFKHTDGYNEAPLISQKSYDDINANQKLSYQAGDHLELNASVGYYSHKCIDEDEPFYPMYSDINESLGATYQWDNASFLKMEHAGDRYTTMKYITYSGNENKEYENTLLTNRVVYTSGIGNRHSLQMGLELLTDELYAITLQDNYKEQMTTSVFASDEYAHNDKLSMVASARYVHGSTFGATFVPGLSAMYKLNYVNLRGSYAMGYRAPTLKELYMDFDHLGWFTMVGNPDLKAESSQYTSVSAEYHKARFTASVSLYHNVVNDKIMETSPFDSSLVTYYNVDKARIIGSNIRFKATLLRLIKLSGGLSLQDPINVTTGVQLESTYKVSGNMRFDFSHSLGRGLIGCGFVGRAYSTTTVWDQNSDGEIVYVDCSPYQMYDASMYYNGDRGWSLLGGVKNVFDYTDYAGKSTYSPGRTFSLSLTYNFNTNK